jgi:hypothetical protein
LISIFTVKNRITHHWASVSLCGVSWAALISISQFSAFLFGDVVLDIALLFFDEDAEHVDLLFEGIVEDLGVHELTFVLIFLLCAFAKLCQFAQGTLTLRR